jgi:hypothetical protein
MQAPTADDATWLTLGQAAQLLECSIDTVRRRLKRGELEQRQQPGPHGPTWYVRLPVAKGMPTQAADGMHGDAAEAAQGVTAPISGLVELLERTQAELVRKAEAAAMWQARAELLHGQLSGLEEQLRALQAPSASSSPVPDGERPPAAAADRGFLARLAAALGLAAVLLVVLVLGAVGVLASMS